MKKIYKARTGAPFKEEDAQRVGETIESLKDRDGKITTEMIVDFAKDTESGLHSYFEWDDSEAAKQFRSSQARQLINHVVEIIVIAGEKTEQRSFVSVNDGEEGKGKAYVTLSLALKEEPYRKQLLNKMIATMKNLTVTMELFRQEI